MKLKVFTAFSGYDSQCMALDKLGIDYELVWKNRDQLVAPYEYAVTWIKELQEAGYRVYLLSNYPANLFAMHS